MAITQSLESTYKGQKAGYWSQANSFMGAIDADIVTGDVIAYKKGDMFYAVKVIEKNVTMYDDVTLTVKGVRFKFEQLGTVGTTPAVDYTRIQVGDIFCGKNSDGGYVGLGYYGGFCQNGKTSAMSGGNDPQGTPGTPSACISYAEFFDKEELTISGLLHAGTPKQTDDITQITVLPDNSSMPVQSYTNGTQAINKIDSGGTELVLNGIARQLAWNFKYSVV